MKSINPYINFDGNCEEAFLFYQSIFGGEFPYIGRFSDMPTDGEFKVPESAVNKIMHVSLPIGDSVLMGSDSCEGFGPPLIVGNNFSVSIDVDSDEEVDRVFNALAEGGSAQMPPSKTFWNSYFGMLTDKFGINWMVSHELPEDQAATE
jgi:PhnB protein